jgi:hypothetical protein
MATLLLPTTNVSPWLIIASAFTPTPLWLTNAIVLVIVLTMTGFKLRLTGNKQALIKWRMGGRR